MIVKNVENKEKNLVAFQVEVGSEAFDEAVNNAYMKNKKKLSVPGFRTGKASRMVIEGMYGEDVFYDDAINDIAGEAFRFAVEEQKLNVVGQPTFKDANVDDAKVLTMGFETALYPEVVLGQYKELETEREDDTITDKHVEDYLAEMRKRNGRQAEVERPAEMGDTVVIDFEGMLDGVPFDGGKGENHSLELGSNSFIPGFEELLVGIKSGEEKAIDITFPEDYQAEDLKGKATVFNINCHQVLETELPPLDDEFAKDVSEFDTLDEYKKTILDELVDKRKKACDEGFAFTALKNAADNMIVDIPEAMIEERMNKMIQDYDRNLMAQGIRLEEYIRMSGMTPDAFGDMLRPQATAQIKTDILLKAVAEAENIELSEQEIDDSINEIAGMYGIPAEQVQMAVPRESVIEDMKRKKANDVIVDSAIAVPISEKEE